MDIDKIASLVPLISIAGTIGLGVFTWYTRRGNDKADAASVLTGSALALVQALEKRIEDVEDDLKAERTASASLRASIIELQRTVDNQAKRIETLENENGRLVAENEHLKNWRGGRI